MEVFVTGATGFIGDRLCELLRARGESVVGLTRRKPLPGVGERKGRRYVIGDISDTDLLNKSLQGAKYCIHLAGLSKPWARDAGDFYRVNVEGTTDLLKAAESNRVEKFVFVSTAGVFGPSLNSGDILDETRFGDPESKTHYDRSKMMAEQVVKEFADAGKVNATIVNPTRVFGPGKLSQSNALAMILRKIIQAKFQILPNSNSVGNYVFVDDVVQGIVASIESGSPGQNYILGGQNLAWNEMVSLMCELVGHPKQRVVAVPEWAIELIAATYDLRAGMLGIEPKITASFVRRYRADHFLTSERAKKELGYAPTCVREAISRTIAWLRSYDQ